MNGDKKSFRNPIPLFILISLLFSALPFILALIMDKSSLGLAFFTIWYPVIPPAVVFIIAWIIHRNEQNVVIMTGRIWIGAGTWFAVQFILLTLSGLHILIKLLAFPAVAAGGKGFGAGTLIFFCGGAVLYYFGIKKSASIRAGNTGAGILPGFLMGGALCLLLAVFIIRSTPSGAGSGIDESKVSPENEIYSWIEEVYNLGIRRTGSPADQKAVEMLKGKLRQFGITDVRVEPYRFDYWEPVKWQLRVKSGPGKMRPVTSFFVPYSGPTGEKGVTAEMVYLGPGGRDDFKKADVKGKIILVDLPPVNISWDKMKVFSYLAYDPDKSTKGWEHPYPIGWMFKYEAVYELAKEHGAAGIVGILQGYPDMGEFTYYAPYDGILRVIPSLYIRQGDGDLLKAGLKKGKTEAGLVLTAKTAKNGGATATVYGILPGKSSSSLLIHCHHDAPWRSGIEDSAGVGMVLSLAKYFAKIPPEQRDRTLIFMFTGSHMVGSKSNYAFIDHHRKGLLKNMLYDICIEHIADDYNPPEAATGNPEPRGVFVTENPVMVSLYSAIAVRQGITRLLVFPTGTPLGVPTDAQPFHNEDYSVASLISGPSWLFDAGDTLERVAKQQLVPLTKFYIALINAMGKRGDWMLSFNLNILAIVFLVIVFTPVSIAGFRCRR